MNLHQGGKVDPKIGYIGYIDREFVGKPITLLINGDKIKGIVRKHQINGKERIDGHFDLISPTGDVLADFHWHEVSTKEDDSFTLIYKKKI